jgi:hypothetical protein
MDLGLGPDRIGNFAAQRGDDRMPMVADGHLQDGHAGEEGDDKEQSSSELSHSLSPWLSTERSDWNRVPAGSFRAYVPVMFFSSSLDFMRPRG